MTHVNVSMPSTPAVKRVQDLTFGQFFRKEGRLWMKLDYGYCLRMDDLVKCQVRGSEQVERTALTVSVEVREYDAAGS